MMVEPEPRPWCAGSPMSATPLRMSGKLSFLVAARVHPHGRRAGLGAPGDALEGVIDVAALAVVPGGGVDPGVDVE
jgi:hypothetical protein